ncbi:MAG: substrate-binding domain-containing protein [Streptosporangiaceae bacterium]
MTVRIPDEVSVIGFDDIFASGLVTPALTTVAAPLRMMGATAVTNLIALIGGARSRSDQPAVLPVKLVVRASTAPRVVNTIAPSPGPGKVSGPAGAG